MKFYQSLWVQYLRKIKEQERSFFPIVLGKMIKDFKVIIKNFVNIIITNLLIIQLYIYNLNLHRDKNNIYFYELNYFELVVVK